MRVWARASTSESDDVFTSFETYLVRVDYVILVSPVKTGSHSIIASSPGYSVQVPQWTCWIAEFGRSFSDEMVEEMVC